MPIDFLKGKDNRRKQVFRIDNGPRGQLFNLIVQKNDTLAQQSVPISYGVDPSVGYFNQNQCSDEFAEDSIRDMLGDQFKYNEFKAQVEKCLRILSDKKPIQTVFVDSGVRLVLNCR